MKPWEKLGISESTYWRRKRDSRLSNDSDSDSKMTVDDSTNDSSVTVPSKIVFDGTNGNICGNITRSDIERVKPKTLPNWYRAGFNSKLDAIEALTTG